jgi:hypothetical protein
MTMLLKVTSTGGWYPEPGLPGSGEGGYSDRVDRSERPGFLSRWRAPLLGLGVIGALTVAGAAILTLILMVLALANILTTIP